ncbi:MAG: HNH endonuclease signature motif containing protein [Nitrospiria bacterium]
MELQKFIEEGSIPVTESGCWLWLGYDNGEGYGRTRLPDGGKLFYAHRLSYEAFIGKIPKGLQLDHLCRVPSCVNPKHLEPVTNRENTIRGTAGDWQLAKTHCPQGHPYSGDNLVLVKNGKGRACKICKVAYHKKYFQDHKEKWKDYK